MKIETKNELREAAYEQSVPHLKQSMEVAKEVRYNRKYKDTLFSALFKDKRYAKFLYEALFPDAGQINEDDITFLNLENIFTIDIYNDACILVKNRLIVLTEHQATINRNMPLRMLLYIAEEYKRIFSGEKRKELYKRRITKIPSPAFYVVYTGIEENPPLLRLSEAFHEPVASLELTVQMIHSQNAIGILNEFISLSQEIDASVRSKQGLEKVNRIRETVKKYEDSRYLLSAFLKERGDVADMINETLDYHDFLEIQIEAALEEGIEQGIERGIEQGIKQGVEQGIKQGVEQGIKQGVEQGIKQGVEEMLKSFIAAHCKKGDSRIQIADDIMNDFGLNSEEVSKYIEKYYTI